MKERRNFLKRMGGLTALLATGSAARSCTPAEEQKGEFMHVVFFWLADQSPETKQKFESELRPFIENVKEIQSKHIGTPAATRREVIDSSWDYSLVLGFRSREEQDIYQEHELHKKFIENASMLWKKVIVYDSLKT